MNVHHVADHQRRAFVTAKNTVENVHATCSLPTLSAVICLSVE